MKKKGYELNLLLKQGYYDYAYAFLKDGTNVADFGLIEGNHFETGNDYYIMVYWKNQTSSYHHLAGIQAVNNHRQKK